MNSEQNKDDLADMQLGYSFFKKLEPDKRIPVAACPGRIVVYLKSHKENEATTTTTQPQKKEAA